jgi:hypothetical protein
VHRRIEAIAAPSEGVRVAAGAVVPFDDEDALALAGEQRRGRQAAEAASDDDDVVAVVLGLFVETHAA